VPVKLRLMRMGKTKQPTYRLVATDSRSPRNGRFIELLGTYEPRQEPSRIKLNGEKITKWLESGAQPTETVQKLLVAEGILTGEAAAKTMAAKKMAKRPVKQKKVVEAPAAAAEEAPVEGKSSGADEAASEAETSEA
jgi:small subunit ribosomal protein S16